MKLVLDLENLEGNSLLESFAIVPAKASGKIIARFKKKMPGAPYKCSYNWKIVLGDISKTPDLNYNYSFPYQNQLPYEVSQGPGGSFSHENSFAFDFVMPVGTPVTAARDGLIALVLTDSDIGGPKEEFIHKANFISILHSDGTIANYYHLNKNGSAVQEGQIVKKGEVIGFSGNTGYSGGPHLHFEVIQPCMNSETKKWVNFKWESRPLFSFLPSDIVVEPKLN